MSRGADFAPANRAIFGKVAYFCTIFKTDYAKNSEYSYRGFQLSATRRAYCQISAFAARPFQTAGLPTRLHRRTSVLRAARSIAGRQPAGVQQHPGNTGAAALQKRDRRPYRSLLSRTARTPRIFPFVSIDRLLFVALLSGQLQKMEKRGTLANGRNRR